MKIKDMLKKLFPDRQAEIDQLDDAELITTVQDSQDKAKGKDQGIEELKTLIAQQSAENKKLLDELAANKKKEEEREKLLEEKARKERDSQIDDIIKKAVEAKRLPAKNEELHKKYKGLLEKDFDSAKGIIESLPVIGGDSKDNSKSGGQQDKQQFRSPLSSGDPDIMKAIQEQNQI